MYILITYVLSVVVVKVQTHSETSPRTRTTVSALSIRRRSLDGVDSNGDKMTITIPTVGVYSSNDKTTIATFPAFQDDLLKY